MSSEIENYEIGNKVKHPKFGTGTVVFRTGEGDKQKVTVKFGSEIGEKKLLAGLANLKVISERPTLPPAEAVEAVPGRARLGKLDDEIDEDDDDDVVVDDDDETEEDDGDTDDEAVDADDEDEVVDEDDEIIDDEDADEDDDEDEDDEEDED